MAAQITLIAKLNISQRNHVALCQPKDPTAHVTDTVASKHINSPAPQTTTPVITAKPVKNFAIDNLNQATELIEKGQFEEALSLLSILIESNKGDKSLLILSAECYIELAFSVPEDSDVQAECVKRAKDFLDAALEITKKEDLSNLTITEDLLCLKLLYEEIQPLWENNQEYSKEIASTIEQLSTYIPARIDFHFDFYKEIEQAQAHLDETGNAEEAREIATEALQLLNEEEDSHLFFLANAEYYIFIAKTFNEDPERTKNSEIALEFARKAYEQEKTFLQDFPALKVYENFKNVFFELSQLLPRNEYIMKTHEHCLKVYEHYEYERLKTEPQKEVEKKTYQATKGPIGDSWKRFRLLVAFAFAFIVIAGIFDLSRRSITKY